MNRSIHYCFLVKQLKSLEPLGIDPFLPIPLVAISVESAKTCFCDYLSFFPQVRVASAPSLAFLYNTHIHINVTAPMNQVPGAKDSGTNLDRQGPFPKELRLVRWDRQENKSLPLTLFSALGIIHSMFATGPPLGTLACWK